MSAPEGLARVPPGVPAPAAFVHGVRAALARPPEGIDPWFHRYLGELADDVALRTWVRAKRQLVDLAGGVAGKVVVDAGSGFGMVSNLLAHWGAERVFAVEVHTPMTVSHARINAAHFPELSGHVLHVRGDASAMPIRSGSADLVLSIEAISHYFDVDAFLDECARVLRPGGALVVSDGNNGANPRIRRGNDALWERIENGPHGPVGEHDVQETNFERRERVIRGCFPELDAAAVRGYAETTAGLDRRAIVEAIRRHRAGGPAPDSRYRRGDLPRDPEWGYVVERLIDPRDLVRDLDARGFRARAFPHFGGARNDLLLAANAVLRRLPTIRFAPAFRLVAVRM